MPLPQFSPAPATAASIGLGNVDNTSDATKNSATATLANKTLTTPIIAQINDTAGNAAITTSDNPTGSANHISISNAATTAAPSVTATGSDTNISLYLSGKGTGVTKSSNRIQLGSSNSTPSGVFAQTGWGWFTSGASNSSLSGTITFPTAFNNLYSITVSVLGAKAGSDPTSITDLTSDYPGVYASTTLPTNTGFKIYVATVNGGIFGSGQRWAFSWIAYGS